MTGFLNVVFISGRKAVVQIPIITVLESYERSEVLFMVRSTKAEAPLPHYTFSRTQLSFAHKG
jgi:hypothetical protein